MLAAHTNVLRAYKGRFGVDKCCWSAIFDSGPTRFAGKDNHGREIYKGEGGATARLLGLSRERWRVA